MVMRWLTRRIERIRGGVASLSSPDPQAEHHGGREQQRDREHSESSRVGSGGGLYSPHHGGPECTPQIPDGIDESDASRRGGLRQKERRQRPEGRLIAFDARSR